MYESIYEPINAVRPPSELSSTYSMSSLSQSITTREHETEVDSLTDLLVNSMSVNDGKKNLDGNASCLDCKYLFIVYSIYIYIHLKVNSINYC